MICIISIPLYSMDNSTKTTINTLSYILTLQALHVDHQTSQYLSNHQKYHNELLSPCYKTIYTPLCSALAFTFCATDHPIAGIIFAQQAIQSAYIRKLIIKTAVENLIDQKKEWLH